MNQYIYIVQSSLEPAKCKIGITNNLARRLKEYNNMTGASKDNIYKFLFTCEVSDMRSCENDIKKQFPYLREQKSKEIYFYNDALFAQYVSFIKSNKNFKKEIFVEKEETKKVKLVQKTTVSLKDRGLTFKSLMQKAKNSVDDEFYTRYEDVCKELDLYPKTTFKDKCIFCNCDDAVGETQTEKDSSAFALYFLNNFMKLGLKKLICTHYNGQLDLFNSGAKGYIFTKEGVKEITNTPKNYTGSFNDSLSLKILKEEADVVCTNPPFSLAIEYWKTIVGSGKKFIIVSNKTNFINTSYIHYFKDRQAWAGYNRIDWYLNPKRQLVSAPGFWYTNIKIKDRPRARLLSLVKLNEIPEKYKKYDDDGILLVDNCYAPIDYDKPFAVSINPLFNGLLEKGFSIIQEKQYVPYIGKKKKFARVLVKKD